MIITPTADGWRCITQPDHARLSREILSLWRSDGLPDHPRRETLLVATREHDNGWQEADSAPRLNRARGCPHDFISMPSADRLALWRRGVERHRQDMPYVAALILEHARRLHSDAATEGAWAEFLSMLDSLRGELLEESGESVENLLGDYRWLEVADSLSLAMCSGLSDAFECHGFNGQLLGETLHLEPFPLAGSTTFSVACRCLAQGDWDSDAEIAVALAQCPWREATFRIAPATQN